MWSVSQGILGPGGEGSEYWLQTRGWKRDIQQEASVSGDHCGSQPPGGIFPQQLPGLFTQLHRTSRTLSAGLGTPFCQTGKRSVGHLKTVYSPKIKTLHGLMQSPTFITFI